MGIGKGNAGDVRKLEQGRSDLLRGVVTSLDLVTGIAIVNVSGGSIKAQMVGDVPTVGRDVWVGYLGNQPIVLGPVARYSLGTTSGAASGGFQSVILDNSGGTFSLPYLGTAHGASVRVAVAWGPGGGVILQGDLSAEPVGITPVVPAGSTSVVKTFTFNPTSSGNWYNSSAWTGSDPRCGDTNKGAYFYGGSTIGDTIPNSAEFIPNSLRIFLSETYNQFPSSRATLGRHDLSSKSGDPSPAGTITIPDCSGGRWVDLPDSWEDEFRTNTAKGVAFDGGGNHIYKRAGSGNSGVLVGKWRVTA